MQDMSPATTVRCGKYPVFLRICKGPGKNIHHIRGMTSSLKRHYMEGFSKAHTFVVDFSKKL